MRHPPHVFVLGVVHHLHARYEGYTYWHVDKIITAYGPDLVCIEVGPSALETGDYRLHSPEKWGIALAWGVAHGVPVAAVASEPTLERVLELRAAEKAFRAAPEGQAVEARLQADLDRMLAEAGGLDNLMGTYQAANNRRSQDLFRAAHALKQAALGGVSQGALTGHWDERNIAMAQRTAEATMAHGARRVIVVVGCEHKYALDDLLGESYGFRVRQLDDFLAGPVLLSPEETAAFRRGEDPIWYPSDLIYVHRRLHGGEPNSFELTLPSQPDGLDITDIEACLDSLAAGSPSDLELRYYRGLYFYIARRYDEALACFEAAAFDRKRRIGYTPLWELALLRQGQMLDLLARRPGALSRYRRLLAEGSGLLEEQVSPLLEIPFSRPQAAG